jgi:hypothetical protein
MVIFDGIPVFRGTEKARNSVPNSSPEEKTARNSVRGTKIEANSRNSVLHPSAEEKTGAIETAINSSSPRSLFSLGKSSFRKFFIFISPRTSDASAALPLCSLCCVVCA